MSEEVVNQTDPEIVTPEYDNKEIRLFFIATAELYYTTEENNSVRVLDKLIFNFPQGNIYYKDYNNLTELAKKYLVKKYNIVSETISNVNVLWLYQLATCTEYDFYTKGGEVKDVSYELKDKENTNEVS